MRRHHPPRWVAAAVILLLAAMLAHALVTEKNLEWGVVGHYLFNRQILGGLVLTIELTVTAMAIAMVIGVAVALMGMSENPVLKVSATLYVWFFRSVPALVQLIFWFNLAILIPRIGIGVPFGPVFASASSYALIGPLVAANLGLGLNEGAYMAEIVRSGISSVDRGQADAAEAMGLSRSSAMRHVILPQALRVMVPPIGNEIIAMLKYTSLASVISVSELLESAQIIYQRTYQTIPLLIVAAIWYVVLTTAVTLAQRGLERRLNRGIAHSAATRTAGSTAAVRGWLRQALPTRPARSEEGAGV